MHRIRVPAAAAPIQQPASSGMYIGNTSKNRQHPIRHLRLPHAKAHLARTQTTMPN